jgi:hypothetical protein
MNGPLNSHDFSERYRTARWRELVMVVVAIGPAGLYLLQNVLRDGRPFPGFTPGIDELMSWGLFAWFALVLLGPGRNVWKKAGLTCPQCKSEFRNTAFHSVMSRGRCPRCDTSILSDVGSSTTFTTEELVFRYPRGRAIFLLICLPLVGGFGLFMVIGFASVLFESSFTLKRALAGLFLILLGLAAIFLAAVLGRTWRSLFTEYVVSGSGISVRYGGESNFHHWSGLESARYRRLLHQLVLRFHGESRPVILSNAEEDPEETTLLLTKNLVERQWKRPVTNVLL